MIEKIRSASAKLESVSNDELRTRSLALKHVAMCGCPVPKMIDDGFPLVVEAARRALGIRYYDVQLQCGIEMTRGRLAEMKTGEGKTVTASLAGYLLSLYGKGLHLVTFNDYLAERDCEYNRPIFDLLGQRVAYLTDAIPPDQRERAYQCDITYGSAKEFGFDFLRDRLKHAASPPKDGIMRGMNYALIDEADSILIDEARTPLIIGMEDNGETLVSQACYRWAAEHAGKFQEGVHYTHDPKQHKFSLDTEGIRLVRSLPQHGGTTLIPIRELYRYVENAIRVREEFHRDKNYAVRDDEVVIIDEFTGRPAEGRQWQDGIHQSVQAKEGVEISPATRQAASITIQSLFKRYEMFCGMTGTAWTSRRELAKVYKKRVVRIPTHRPIDRKVYSPRVFANQANKFAAIAISAKKEIDGGRAVLIGTRSIEHSEALADHLRSNGLDFQILNAKHLQREGDIVAEAGQAPRITIATNMAGRGTDIKLAGEVRAAGGLHVILTEIHESERIDWQLIGRGSRQGDPGSYQVFVALSDEILKVGLGPKQAKRLQNKYANASDSKLQTLYPLFRRAQRKTERKQLTDRMMVLRSDEDKKRAAFEMGQDPYLSSVNG